MPFAEVDDVRVRYEEWGAGDPVLLVAGLAADHRLWAGQVEALGAHWRVIAYDHPGIGLTTGAPGPYTTAGLADVAAGLLGALAIERAHVVGWSLGGAVAQELALRHPGRVRSLSLHSTWGRSDAHLTAVMRSWQTYARAVPFLDLCRQLWLWVFTVWVYNDHPERLAELERLVEETPELMTPDGFCDQAEACIAHDALDRLGEVDVPTMITVGDRDPLTPPHHAYRLKEAMPAARLRVWQKMGHAALLETPDEFNARVHEFLEACP